MKKLLSLITAAFLLCGISVTASAQSIYEMLHGVSWTQIEPLPDAHDISIPGTITITKNTTFTNKNIILETNGIIQIKNGASLTLKNSCIYVENGGTIRIIDGTLKLKELSSIGNNGIISVGETGKLNVTYGSINIYPQGKFINNGKFTGYRGKNLNSALSQIKKFDSSFDLSDYVMFLNTYPDTHHDSYMAGTKIYLYYRIDNIQTDYRYVLDIKNGKLNITHPDQPASDIYTPELINSLRARAQQYIFPEMNYTNVQRRQYYLYYHNATEHDSGIDMEAGTMIAESVWFCTDGEVTMDDGVSVFI